MRSKTLSGSNAFSDLKRPVAGGAALIEGTLVPSKVDLGAGYKVTSLTNQVPILKTTNSPITTAARLAYPEDSTTLPRSVVHASDGTFLYRFIVRDNTGTGQFSLFQRSADLGVTWTTLANPGSPYSIYLTMSASSTHVVLFYESASSFGFYKYNISTSTWSSLAVPTGLNTCQRVYSTPNGFLICGTEPSNGYGRIFTLDSTATTFTLRLNLDAYTIATGRVFSYLNNGYAFVSAVNNSTQYHWFSTNYGVNWTMAANSTQVPYYGKTSSDPEIYTYQGDMIIVKFFDTSNGNAQTFLASTNGTTWTNITSNFSPLVTNSAGGNFANIITKIGANYVYIWTQNGGNPTNNNNLGGIFADIYNSSFVKLRTIDMTVTTGGGNRFFSNPFANNRIQGAQNIATAIFRSDMSGANDATMLRDMLISEDTVLVNSPRYPAVDSAGAALSYYQKLA